MGFRQATVGIGLALLLVGKGTGAEPIRAGSLVYAQSSASAIKVEEKVVGSGADLAHPVAVREVNGDWLLVWMAARRAEGWIRITSVVPQADAIAFFTKKLGENANDEFALLSRSQAYEYEGKLAKAIEDKTQILKLRPTPASYNSRGSTYYKSKMTEQALADFNEAIRLNPKFAPPYNNRGVLFRDKGEVDKALADFEQAATLDPKYAAAHCNVGIGWHEKGDIAKAMASFNQALALDDQHAEAFANRGLCWQESGQFDKALADFLQAVKLNPKLTLAYNNAAWLYATCSDPSFRNGKLAVEMAIKASTLTDGKDAGALDTLAAAHAEAGEFDQAVTVQKKALDLADKDQKGDYQKRLELYSAKKPYHEAPAK